MMLVDSEKHLFIIAGIEKKEKKKLEKKKRRKKADQLSCFCLSVFFTVIDSCFLN